MKYLLILCVFTSFVFAKLNIAVSIIPQKNFVEKIAGEKANVFAIVKPGASPHTYEPKPSELKEISQANIYFPIKIDFENAWLEKFATQNRDMKIVEMTKGVNFITMKKHKHHGGKEETIIKPDPHTWTSALNVKIMAKTIYETLIEIEAVNKKY